MKIFFKLMALMALMASISTGYAEVILTDLYGQNISLSSLKGKWVLINYWAEWCQTCLDEIPEFNRFYKKHQNDAMVLFGVNYDALPLFKQKKLVKQFNITYPNLSTDPSPALRLGDITGVPVTFIFNPKGVLVKTLYGGQTTKNLEKVVTSH